MKQIRCISCRDIFPDATDYFSHSCEPDPSTVAPWEEIDEDDEIVGENELLGAALDAATSIIAELEAVLDIAENLLLDDDDEEDDLFFGDDDEDDYPTGIVVAYVAVATLAFCALLGAASLVRIAGKVFK